MSALGAAWRALMEAAQASAPNPAHVDHGAMAVLQLAVAATPDEIADVLHDASGLIRSAPLAVAAPVAMTCGALIEQGAPASEVAQALLARMPEVLSKAQAFAVATEQLAASGSGDPGPGSWVGDWFAPAHWMSQEYDRNPGSVVAWHELRRFALPMVAAASRDRVVLEHFVTARLGPDLDALRHIEPHARFLWILNHLLLDTLLRFVDLDSGRVFDLRIDAVATNFELHTLLIAALAEPLDLEPPPAEIVACLRGAGPRQLLTKSESAWALYAHTAQADLIAGRKVKMDQWVWNESIPSEIPAEDGTRILLGGPQSYARQWETGRTFASLGGTVELVTELSD